jgi:hypothetical protein
MGVIIHKSGGSASGAGSVNNTTGLDTVRGLPEQWATRLCAPDAGYLTTHGPDMVALFVLGLSLVWLLNIVRAFCYGRPSKVKHKI